MIDLVSRLEDSPRRAAEFPEGTVKADAEHAAPQHVPRAKQEPGPTSAWKEPTQRRPWHSAGGKCCSPDHQGDTESVNFLVSSDQEPGQRELRQCSGPLAM